MSRARVIALVLLALGCGLPSAANDTTPDVDRREAELTAIRAEISKLESRLTEMRTRESGLEDELERTRVELRLQEERLDEATAARDLASAKAEATSAKVDELEIALRETRDDLSRRLTGLYRLGRQGYLRLFLSLEPDQSLLPAIRQLRFLVLRDQQVLDRYTATREELAVQRQALEAELAEKEAWQQRENERRNELVAVRKRQERLLAKVAEERKTLAARTDALQDKERKFALLIESLVDANAAPLEGTPIQSFRGALDWPFRGEVVGRFGIRRDPRYHTEVPHNGIDVAVEEGSDIHVVFPGSVLYAGPFEGYGNMVIVHHPGRVFTLYSGLRDLKVKKGDVLSLGDVLGSGGEQIYFEIRNENLPEDPLTWLR